MDHAPVRSTRRDSLDGVSSAVPQWMDGAWRAALLLIGFLIVSDPARAFQDAPQDKVCRLCHAQVTTTFGPRTRAHGQVGCVGCHTALAKFDPTDGEHAVRGLREALVQRVSCEEMPRSRRASTA